jgi:signal transduction histidine kinase
LLCGSGGMIFAVWAVRRHQKKSWQRRLDRLEQQGVLERERTRIARDFHDDLGSRLSHITMLSESACRHPNNSPETVTDLERIAAAAREFTRSMEEIVWAVDPENDSLDELATFISGFAQDLLHSVKVRCRLDMPLQLPDWSLSAEIRHNIFMAFKEALNNALKHGHPTEVQITMNIEAFRFILTVEDNGRGFAQGRDLGHGLKNMSSRLQKCGGDFFLESEPGHGTRVRFVVPVKPATQAA